MKWYNWLIFALIVLVTVLSGVQSASAITLNDATFAYKFENNVLDYKGVYNGTTSRNTYVVGEINMSKAFNFSQLDRVNTGFSFDIDTTVISFCSWYWLNDTANNRYTIAGDNFDADGSYWGLLHRADESGLTLQTGGAKYSANAGNIARTWTHFCITKNGTSLKWYVNGVNTANHTTSGSIDVSRELMVGTMDNSASNVFNGAIDEFYFFNNKELTQSEVTSIYTGTSTVNVSVSLSDSVSGATLQNFSVSIGGVNYSTTNGTIYTMVPSNSTSLFNVSVFNISDNGGYFNQSFLNQNVSTGSLALTSYQANITVKAYAKVTNASLSGSIFNVGSLLGSTNSNISYTSGTFNLTYYNTTYTNKTQQFTISALSTPTLNITGVYNAILNISAYNTTGSAIPVFNGWVSYNGGFNESFSTTTGSVLVYLITGLNYTVYAKSNSHAQSNDTNYKVIEVDSGMEFTNFTFYPYNSIYLNIKDESTGSSIYSNSTVKLNGPMSGTRSINATYTYANLTAGTYTLTISNPLYQTRVYSVTVDAGTTQSLTAFLSNSTAYVGIITYDSYNNAVIENATVSLYTYVNDTYTLLEVKNTDITGRAQFNYIASTSYSFVVQKTNYITKTFNLNPILYDSYDVMLDRSILYVYTGSQEDVRITYAPTNYWANQSTNFSIIFSSATGVLNSYGVNVTWKCGNFSLVGNNSIGQTLSQAFTINCTSYRDTINISYYYTSVGNEQRVYNAMYYISGSSSGNNYTWVNMKDNHFGMGLLERITIVVFLALIVGGMSYLMIGNIGALVLSMLVFGYFLITGFIPFWSVIISLCAGVLLMIGGKD